MRTFGRRMLVSALAGLTLVSGTSSSASVKPCRDPHGKFVDCPKPRKPVERCKDASGKFAKCPEGQPAGSKPKR